MNILRVDTRLQMGFTLSGGLCIWYVFGRQKEGISIVATRFENFQFRKLRVTCRFVGYANQAADNLMTVISGM
jgi:hypothetical protein